MGAGLKSLALALWLVVVAVGAATAASREYLALDRYYTLRRQGDPQALTVIAAAARQFPDNLTMQLEWGYGALAVKDYEAARTAFRAATRIAPGRADLWKQLGYIEITRKDIDAAIAAFERAIALVPSDTAILLQIGYLEEGRGRRRAATERFREAMHGSDRELAKRGCEAYSVLRGLPDKLLPEPYTTPEYIDRYNLGVLSADLRVGQHYGEATFIDVYGIGRLNKDTKSGATTFGTQLFVDNFASVGVGVRGKPLADVPLVLFAEAGAAYDLVYQDRPRWRGDFRAAAAYYNEWNMGLDCGADRLFGIRPVADVYADAAYYSRYDNLISFARARPGLRVFETEGTAIDLYATAAIDWDVAGVASNRYVELGFGVAFRLYDPTRLVLRVEGVRNFATDADDFNYFRVLMEYAVRF
jgi:tetratricopeptide (TPR) repeat protein